MQEGKLACTSFPPQRNDVVRNSLVLVQEGKLARAIFPPQWNDVVRNALALVKEEKLACVISPPLWISKCTCARRKDNTHYISSIVK